MLPLVLLSSCTPGLDFLDLRVEDIGPSSAVVRFDTSRATTCAVVYGVATGTLDLTATDPSMAADDPYALTHNVPLFELAPDADVFYRARAEDPEGRVFLSDEGVFHTLVAAEDLGPNVALGAVVSDVSSNFGGAANDATWGADAAVDGALATEWATDGDGTGAWLDLDLASPVALSTVRVRSREMADGTAIVTAFTLTVGGGAAAGLFEMPDPGVMYTFDLGAQGIAAHVRLDVTDSTGGNTGLRELELYE